MNLEHQARLEKGKLSGKREKKTAQLMLLLVDDDENERIGITEEQDACLIDISDATLFCPGLGFDLTHVGILGAMEMPFVRCTLALASQTSGEAVIR